MSRKSVFLKFRFFLEGGCQAAGSPLYKACSISSQIPVIEPYHKPVLHVQFPHKFSSLSLTMNKFHMLHFLTNSCRRALWTSSVWPISSQIPVTEPYHEPVLRVQFPHKFPSLGLIMNKFRMFHSLTNSRHRASRTSSACSISSQIPASEPYREPVLHVPFPHKFPSQSLMNQFCMVHTLIPNISIFTFNIIIPPTPISDLVPWHFAVKIFYLLHTTTCMLQCKPISSSIQLFEHNYRNINTTKVFSSSQLHNSPKESG
jgi:hypothetical protein